MFHGPVDDDDALDDDARARTGRRPAAAATTRARDARDGDARDDAGGDANERRVAARLERAAPDLEQLLAAGARDPEVLSQALAALPADQRETFEAQLKAAGVM